MVNNIDYLSFSGKIVKKIDYSQEQSDDDRIETAE